MTSAQFHRRAANLIKKRYQSKFPDTSNLALEPRRPPKEWLTRQPPSYSDLFGTAETDVICECSEFFFGGEDDIV